MLFKAYLGLIYSKQSILKFWANPAAMTSEYHQADKLVTQTYIDLGEFKVSGKPVKLYLHEFATG